MSLMRNEDFLIWHLRTSYLTHFKDGIGERLITLDPTLLNDPKLRVTGLGGITQPYRTYSPPIPVATAVSEEYFNRPQKAVTPVGRTSKDNDNGIVDGRRGSRETIGPGRHATRRRRRDQGHDDDSSDLSDESDEDAESTHRATQRIKFAKMPVRTRAGSSPVRSLTDKEPQTLPVQRRSAEQSSKRSSGGAVETVNQRARRGTTTSSDVSSDDDVHSRTQEVPTLRSARRTEVRDFLHARHTQLQRGLQGSPENDLSGRRTTSDNVKAASSLSSELAGTADSTSLLGADDNELGSSLLGNMGLPHLSENLQPSPKKGRPQHPKPLAALPPTRPISTVIPGSALGQAIRARKAKLKTPEELYARFSGKGSLDALNIRIYIPSSNAPQKPFEMPLQRKVQDPQSGALLAVTVADTIGLCLWRYHEENLQPPIAKANTDVNRWTLRIVDDGEVDCDFPPLNRACHITDFSSNNNSRQGRGRARGKAYDEFALVEANEAQYAENKNVTPKYTALFEEFEEENERPSAESAAQETTSAIDEANLLDSAIMKPFAFAPRKGSATLERPSMTLVHATPRMGPSKTLKILFTSFEVQTQMMMVEVTTDTYLAEVLELACKRWKLDKAHHFLRVTGTSTAAPPDRTVEVLGSRTDLDLVRRRFANAGTLGPGRSPASSSPNAPLFLDAANTTPPSKRSRKPVGAGIAHPLSNQQDVWNLSFAGGAGSKRYVVTRKQPMSFAPSHPRTLLLDGEYLHILPGDAGGALGGGTADARAALFDTGASAKTASVPFSMIVGCKVSRRHPKSFRVVIFRERETKRYDFEAQTVAEAEEIVGDIARGMKPFVRAEGGLN